MALLVKRPLLTYFLGADPADWLRLADDELEDFCLASAGVDTGFFLSEPGVVDLLPLDDPTEGAEPACESAAAGLGMDS